MARTAAVTLLTLTPENASYVRETAARLSHASTRGPIGLVRFEQLEGHCQSKPA